MCITPQWSVLLTTFSPLLSVVLLILCFIPLGSAGCPPGQFLHFNLETDKGVCCIPVPLPKGYGFIICEVNGTHDRIEKCPEGLYQEDNTTTESEAICTKALECNHEDNLEATRCDASGQNCVHTCICNYERGYCGTVYYDCRRFPKDCPLELVQRDCSCKRDSPSVTSSSSRNTSNKPGETYITTPSTVPAGGGSKPTQENDGDVDNGNGTVINNGTGSVPDQTQSSGMGLNAAVIATSVVFSVGAISVVILVYAFRRRLKKWLWIYRNFCCQNRSANQYRVFQPLNSIVTSDTIVSGQGELSEQGEEEAQLILGGDGSEGVCDDQKNPAGDQSEGGSIQAGGTSIQSLVIDNDGSEGCCGTENNPAGDQSEGGSIQVGEASIRSLAVDIDGSEGCSGAQNNPAGGQSEGGSIQAGEASIQSLVVDIDGSKSCCGDQKNPAGCQSEAGSIQAGGTSIQSLVVDIDRTMDHINDSAGPFCKCCGRHWKRCNKRNIEQTTAIVPPLQAVNGTRQTAQFLEMPSVGSMMSEMSVDGYSSFSSSINHDLESHDSTNAVDEETTLLKSVNGQEANGSNQILSIVQQTNEVEGACYEESHQADIDNEDCMTTGLPALDDLYRTDSHSGGTNNDEEELTIENEEDEEV